MHILCFNAFLLNVSNCYQETMWCLLYMFINWSLYIKICYANVTNDISVPFSFSSSFVLV